PCSLRCAVSSTPRSRAPGPRCLPSASSARVKQVLGLPFVRWLTPGVDRLVRDVGGQALRTELAAQAAGLDPAEGGAKVEVEEVDADRAGLDAPGEVESPFFVAGPDGAAEPVFGVVGDA